MPAPRPEFEYSAVPNKSGNWRWLGESGVEIELVTLGSDEYDEGRVAIAFAGDGGAEPAELLLLDEHGNRKLVRLLAFTGDVRVHDVRDPR